MTFIEAALEILKQENRPLHAREIARRAVAEEMLYHVGKSPEQTMSKRLSEAVANGDGPLVRVAPGVFALSKNAPSSVPDRAAAARTPKTRPVRTPAVKPAPQQNREESKTVETQTLQKVPVGDTVKAEPAEAKKKKKRRKRRTQKSPEVDGAALSTREQVDTATASTPVSSVPVPSRGDRNAGPAGSSMDGVPGDVCEQVTAFLRRQPHPVPTRTILEHIGLSGNNAHLLLDALLEADATQRCRRGQSSRFRKFRNGWGLTDRELSADTIALETLIFDAVERLQQMTHRQLRKRIRGLPMPGLLSLLVRLLQQDGYSNMAVVGDDEENVCHFSCRREHEEPVPSTVVTIRRETSGKRMSPEDVKQLLRLVRHQNGHQGILVTGGDFHRQVEATAATVSGVDVVLLDGAEIANRMIRLGIGVEHRTISVPVLDETDF